jgi:GPI-anchor transamidase subunit U
MPGGGEPVWTLLAAGAAVRAAGFYALSGGTVPLADRPELVSPFTQWARLVECAHLNSHGHAVYDGDMCTMPPLLVWLASHFLRHFPDDTVLLPALWILLDLLAALCVLGIARAHLSMERRRLASALRQQQPQPMSAEDVALIWASVDLTARTSTPGVAGAASESVASSSSSSSPSSSSLLSPECAAMAAFLLGPWTVLTCLSCSTQVLSNTLVLGGVWFAISGLREQCAAFVVLAVSVTPSMLLVAPGLVWLSCISKSQQSLSRALGSTAFMALAFLNYLLYLSYQLCDRTFSFLRPFAVLFALTDQTPNLGLTWYFTTEVFAEFRLFFVGLFALHPLVYIVPLWMRLKYSPLFLLCATFAAGLLTKPHATLADAVPYLALLFVFADEVRLLRFKFPVVVSFLACAVALPATWHLWLYSGSGNSNFFFGMTVLYNVAHIVLLVDALTVHRLRERWIADARVDRSLAL